MNTTIEKELFQAVAANNLTKVKEILAVNKKKERVANLEDYVVETTQEIEKKFENVVGQDSLTRFDQPKKKPNNRNKKKKPTTIKNAPKKD